MRLAAPSAPIVGGKRLGAGVSPVPAPTPAAVSRTTVMLTVGAITLLAGGLRLLWLARVDGNPFYDAAVRSMGLSLHNLFFGAFEPSGSVSIDKPPGDLWMQVASVKLLGFSSTTLKLPEALAGTLAVPVLFDTVRRVFGTMAGLAGAVALAVLPIAVLTSRSDTMDAVMGLLLVAALWSLVRAGQTERGRWVPVAAVCVGLAFNVKLFEALVPLPAFAVGAWLALRGPLARRLAISAVAVGLLVAVSLSWLSATSLVGSAPYAIGSTNGSPWNAAFVFNGLDRIEASPTTQFRPALHRHTPIHRRKRARVTSPGPARLLARRGSLPISQLGLELLAALALGLPALWARRHESRATTAVALILALWLVTGTVLFSAMSRLHPRYTEAMNPAIAACLGVGVAWLGRTSGRRQALAAVTAIALAAFAVWATVGSLGATLGLTMTVLGVLLVLTAPGISGPRRAVTGRLGRLGTLLVLGGLLVAPTAAAVQLVRFHLSDSGRPGAMPAKRADRLSAFLLAHRDGARYEFASGAATQAGPLIVRDGQAVRILTSYNGRPLISIPQLVADVNRGDVRYVLLGGIACRTNNSELAACSAPARWVRDHGRDVSWEARVGRGLLWQLPRHVGTLAATVPTS